MKSLVINNIINTNYIFSGCSDKLILCCEKEYESKLIKDKILISNCSDICFSNTKKIIIELNKCVEDCNTDNSEYKYEYNNKCYIKCPNGTTSDTNYQFSCIKNDCIYSMTGYTLLNETDKKGNCYIKCNNYYYFDESNEYKCTDSNECPPLYNKLIPEKRKCINECIFDDTYKYEYNNTCYKKCPNNQICKNIAEEDDITTEELTPQVTQNAEIQSTETILINFPTNETQKIAEELTLQITHNTESVSINSNQINFFYNF